MRLIFDTRRSVFLLACLACLPFLGFSQANPCSNDQVPPTAVCNNATAYLNANGQATVSVQDLDGGSSDNCGNVSVSLCLDCYTVDFSVDANGNGLTAGTAITNQYAAWGISSVTASGGINQAWIFDSSNPTGGDPDLGTPNAAFGGPGVGTGGASGAGQNDQPLGNLLIIQENNNIPDDNAGGGDLVFQFSSPAWVGFIDVLDIEDTQSYIELNTTSGTVTFPLADLGDNGVQRVNMNTGGVNSLTVHFRRSGGIAGLNFCGSCSASLDYACADIGSNAVTLNVIDANGNSASCLANVDVVDTISPVIVCNDVDVYLDGNGQATVSTSMLLTSATDNCNVTGTGICAPFEVIDFSGDKNGNPFTAGTSLSNQLAGFGVSSVSATGGINEAWIFDSANPTGGDTDLGTPNAAFGGPGVGNGGASGAGINNTALGNVLIIQENNNNTPDDNRSGGDIVLDFASPVTLGSVTVLDIENTNNYIELTTLSGTVTFPITAIGDNSVQQVVMNTNDVTSMRVHFRTSGAIDNLSLRAECNLPSLDFTCADIGANPVSLGAYDQSGNSAFCTPVVNVFDTIAPVVICNGVDIYLDANGNATVSTNDLNGGATDNCGIAGVGICPPCRNVDFSMDGNGNPLAAGTSVTNQLSAFGIASVTASGGINEAWIFDSSNPTGGDTDLGTPNAAFSGPGIGTGGASGTGQNDVALGNLLIIQENNNSIPDDDRRGGDLVFGFTGPSTVTSMTIVDIDGNNSSYVELQTVNGTVSFPLADLGDNSVQTLMINTSGVTQMTVHFGGSGGIGEMNICGPCDIDSLNFTCADVGPNPVTISATDVNGNSASCASTVTVIDSVAPSVTCNDITVYLDANGQATITAGDIHGSSSDNCAVDTFFIDVNSFGCADLGPNAVTVTVIDVNGNSSTCTGTVTVVDTIAPSITCPADLTVACLGDVSAPGSVTSNDNCGVVSSGLQSESDNGGAGCANNPLIITRVFQATDASGNTSTCTQLITVIDDVNPVAVCQDITVHLDANGNATISANMIDNGSNDNCSAVTLSLDRTSFTCADLGTVSVALTVTDACGNSSTCSSTVTVVDTIAPSITCPADIVVACASDVPAPDSVLNASDNCAVVSMGLLSETDNGGQGCASSPLVITRTYQATDASGNSATCTQTITVVDDVAPVAICRDITVTLDENGNATITAAMIDNGSNDNCSGVTLSIDRDSFTCADTGTVAVTLTVTDDCGNSSSCTGNVTIEEGHFVEIVCPDDITTNCETGNGGAYVSWPEPTAVAFSSCSEPCPPNHISGFIYLGEYNGHRYYCSSSSNFTWTQANNIAGQNGGYLAVINDAQENAYLRSQLMASYAWIGLTDQAQEGTFEWVNGDPLNYTNWKSGEPNNVGGNCCTSGGADHVVLRRNNGKWYDRYSCNRHEFIMEVPCSEPVTVTQISGPANGDLFPQGTTVVTYVATDSYGNTDTCSFNVTVEQQFEIVCPSDITVPCVNAHNGAYVHWTAPDVIFETCDTNACPQNTHISGFIYMGEFNGNRYYCSNSSNYTWTQANNIASQNGGYLAVINDAQENAFLQNSILASYVWIGLTDQAQEGQFEWVNGDPLNYVNWANNQPNNYNGNQDHTVLRRNNGRWYDMNSACSRYEFVMEVPCSGYTLEQVAGPANGSHFPVGTTQVSYIAYTTSGDTVSCDFNVTVEECQPDYCDARGYCSNYEWIQNVNVGSISNNSGNDGGYGDYTNLNTTFTAGSSESITLTPGFSGQSYREYWKVWIDWNRDGDFYDSGEMVYAGSGQGTKNGTIQVPSNAAQGALRMRIAMRWGCWPSGPCCNFHYGEVEDYTIYVSGSAKAGSAPAANDNALLASELDEQDAPSGIEFTTVYPNPVNRMVGSQFSLEFRSGKAESMNLRITDLNGRLLIEKPIEAAAGMNRHKISVENLSTGTYLIELGNGTVKQTEKLVVQ